MGLTSQSTGMGANDNILEIKRKNPNDKIIAFAGNPNTGKSTIFNALTGMHQHTGNWPGKTVTTEIGHYTYNHISYTLVDLPGTYSLIAKSGEEEVARDFIESQVADAIVVVVDATVLERNLNLVMQAQEISNRVIVCCNLMDEATKKGIKINKEKLSNLLDAPVVCTTATNKDGLKNLMKAIENMAFSKIDDKDDLKNKKRYTELSSIEENFKKAENIVAQAITFTKPNYLNRDIKIDKILTNKFTGIPIMLLLLALVFWITIVGANYPSQFLYDTFFSFADWLTLKLNAIGAPAWINSVFVEGIYRVVAWVVSVMLPPMAIFFPLFTLLEDSGYLPRIAFVLDKTFQKCKACGKQALTMCMGFGCNCAGVVGCRIIDSPRERLIAIITNNLVPCNGRFPLMITLITIFVVGLDSGIGGSILATLMLTGIILLGILLTFLLSKILSATLLKGVPSSFALEMPPYRKPKIGQVIYRSIIDRTVFVLGRALAIAAPAGLVIWIFANITIGDSSILSICTTALNPIASIFGLDGTILMAFILGTPANEIVVPIMCMSYLAQGNITEMGNNELLSLLVNNGWTWKTAICTMLFSLMHWPCATSLLTIKKETGSLKWTAVAAVAPLVLCLPICFIVSTIFNFIGV